MGWENFIFKAAEIQRVVSAKLMILGALIGSPIAAAEEGSVHWAQLAPYCTGFKMGAITQVAPHGLAWEIRSKNTIDQLKVIASRDCRNFQDQANDPTFLLKFREKLRVILEESLPKDKMQANEFLRVLEADHSLMRAALATLDMLPTDTECGQLIENRAAFLKERIAEMTEAAVAVGKNCSLEQFTRLYSKPPEFSGSAPKGVGAPSRAPANQKTPVRNSDITGVKEDAAKRAKP